MWRQAWTGEIVGRRGESHRDQSMHNARVWYSDAIPAASRPEVPGTPFGV